ncbi:hypothetical protein VTN02DRAFT_5780 [Thermoascus thermophilus]
MSDTGAQVPGGQPDYSTWSTPSLIARITELERQLQSQSNQLPEAPPSTISRPAPPPEQVPPPADTKAPAVAETTATKKNHAPPPDDFTRVPSPHRTGKEQRDIDPSKYHTRFIALKFAYLGQRYNGYEHANGNITPLPTIEEELWKALRKTRLIFPTTASDGFDDSRYRSMRPYTINWDGCQYSKCGRTDRGVSAFGQVIGIRVRSARPKLPSRSNSPEGRLQRLKRKRESASSVGDSESREIQTADDGALAGLDEAALDDSDPEEKWDDIADELPYIQMLNNVLPEDIRILAWCPHPPPDFDARFSCRERRYKYFFTQPAFSPTPGPLGFMRGPGKEKGLPGTKYREGWLDIDAMREGAKYFEGVHDFRNFCRVDTSKQIDNFERIIYHADIELVDPKKHPLGYVGRPGFQPLEADNPAESPEQPGHDHSHSTPQVYAFTLHGSAFLWHQVRHMVSILFLIGQGLESPRIIPELLDVSKNPRKPTYDMASDAPLVLWDCIFPDEKSGSREDALEWVYAGDPRQIKSVSGKGDGKFGLGGIVDSLWTVWRQRKMDEILADQLLGLVVSQGDQSIIERGGFKYPDAKKLPRSQKVFYGGNEARLGGKYVPVMQKKKMETVEVQNAKYLASMKRKAEKKEVDGGAEI